MKHIVCLMMVLWSAGAVARATCPALRALGDGALGLADIVSVYRELVTGLPAESVEKMVSLGKPLDIPKQVHLASEVVAEQLRALEDIARHAGWDRPRLRDPLIEVLRESLHVANVHTAHSEDSRVRNRAMPNPPKHWTSTKIGTWPTTFREIDGKFVALILENASATSPGNRVGVWDHLPQPGEREKYSLDLGGVETWGVWGPSIGDVATDGKRVFVTMREHVYVWNHLPGPGERAASAFPVQGTGGGETWRGRECLVAGDYFFLSDPLKNRVLAYRLNEIPASGQPAFVLGQADLDGREAGLGSGMNKPTALASDGKRLFVSDSGNSRVLVWNRLPTTHGQPADLVLGQRDFDVKKDGADESSFKSPGGILVKGDRLFVVDSGNERVLIWAGIPEKSGEAAAGSIGGRRMRIPGWDSLSGLSGIRSVLGKIVLSNSSTGSFYFLPEKEYLEP